MSNKGKEIKCRMEYGRRRRLKRIFRRREKGGKGRREENEGPIQKSKGVKDEGTAMGGGIKEGEAGGFKM